jgi:hypothetical protein
MMEVDCPTCGTKLPLAIQPGAPVITGSIPVVRSKIKPLGNIHVYRITSEEIKVFLINKAKYFKPEAKIELGVKYCERKGSKDERDHRSFAALTIAFSDDVIDKKADSGWFDKIGESETNVRLLDDIFVEFIKRYQYDRKILDNYLNDYKELEKLEDALGVTESFLEDIRMYTTPRRIATTAKESWIFFAVRPEKVIEDMLQDPHTDKVAGRIHIPEIHQINKDIVEYVVYVHPGEMHASENPLVRQLLTGKKDIKKRK